jgi:hypothetical protein
VIEQSNFLQRAENRNVFSRVRDDSSSLLWLRDSDSEITRKSSFAENLDHLDATFAFDSDLLSSNVYRSAARSSMLRALRVTVTRQWTYDETRVPDDDVRETESSSMTDQEAKAGRRIEQNGNDELLFPSASGVEDSRQRANSIMSEIVSRSYSGRFSIRSGSSISTRSSVHLQMIRPSERLSAETLFNLWMRPQSPAKPVTGSELSEDAAIAILRSKVLLAGTSQSGKSTAIKAINFILGNRSELPRLSKFFIWEVVNMQMWSLLQEKVELLLPSDDDSEYQTLARICESVARSLQKIQLSPFGEQESIVAELCLKIRTIWEGINAFGVLDEKKLCGLPDGIEQYVLLSLRTPEKLTSTNQ